MSQNHPEPGRRKKSSLKTRLALLAVIVFAAWLVHAPVLSWLAAKGIHSLCAANGINFSADHLVVRLDGPVVIEGLHLISTPGFGRLTVLDVSRISWSWGGIGNLFADNGRMIPQMTVEGVSGVLDLSGEPGVGVPVDQILRWVPVALTLGIPSLDVIQDENKTSLRELNVTLSESEAGQLVMDGLVIQTKAFSRAFGPIRARTAWKYGTLWLATMEVLPGVLVDNLSLELLRQGGPALSLTANCFGGSLRADASIGDGESVDLAAWASNIPLNRLATVAGVEGRAAGSLAEARLTFRGKPGRPADAEASLRLVAHGARWNQRGWESLEVAASLIHRRLVVSDFKLEQEANQVGFSGEISLADGWSEIARAPFLLTLKADIREMGKLAGLFGGPLDEASGRMTAAGSVSGRAGRVEGFLSVEASDITFRTLPPSSLRAEAVFRDGSIELAKCDVFSKKDSASLRGTISQSSPHQYAAELDARVADLAMYLSPFHAPGAAQVYAGAVTARWQGDGTPKSHSGAFDIQLQNFVSGATPSGLTGDFSGTYSPQNVYFSKFQVEKGPLKLGTRATIAGSGITLKDLELRSGNTTLLEGGAFLPMNLFAILSGTDWRAAIDPGREAYLRASSPQDLSLSPLLQLAGQDFPLEGKLRLNVEASGLPGRLTAKGSLEAKRLLWKPSSTPPSRLAVHFSASDGAATLEGQLETKGFPALKIEAGMPFGLVHTETGNWRWLNPDGKFHASLDFPRTDLAVFRPLLPKIRRLSGAVSGQLNFSGTLGAPRTTGQLALQGGVLEVSTRTPPVTNANARLAFDGTRMVVEQARAEIGAGICEVTGGVGLANPANPVWDLRLKGGKILLARDTGMRLRANVDLTASGNNSSGLVSGSVRLVDGRIFQRFEITPLLLVAPESAPDSLFPPPLITVPDPFARWALDVKIRNESPFRIRGNIAEGEIIPDLTLTGTLGNPVPIGRVTLRNVQAFLPFTTLLIPDGRVDFLPDDPWVPLLDVRGTASTPDYEIQAYAFGPLDEKKLILRSEPPLPQEAIIVLLTTGIAGSTQGAGFGEAAAGQGGLFLLRSFARQLDLPGVDTDALLNRVQVQAIAPRGLGERASMRGRLRLTKSFDLVTERDGYGFFNAGVTYSWRFR